LLEVLVASTVFSLGMMGLAVLLLTSISSSGAAKQEIMASEAAASLAEQIRLNPTVLDRYLSPPDSVSRMCMEGESCTPEQQADFDFRLWQLELGDRIHNASGIVCKDTTPGDGSENRDDCDGAGPIVIKIFWTRGVSEGTNSGHHRYTLGIS
jgi:type IV pilus assembly protein PilV